MAGIKKFLYKKSSDDISERVLWVLNKPSDSFFGIDLSQFSEDEIGFYISELERIDEIVSQEIQELGLSSCFRRFKEDKVL